MNTNDIIDMLRRCIRHELPIMNRGIEKHRDASLLIHRFRPLAEAVEMAAKVTSDPDVALTLLQLASFGVSSVERHLQIAGGAPGDGVAALGVEATLMRLSRVAGHPPRDSHLTYWLRNTGDAPMTFTGSPQESMFIRIINEMHQRQMASVAAIRPLCMGEMDAMSPMAIEAMEFAAENHERIVMPQMNPAFFAVSLRPYLGSYPVGGMMTSGPDAAMLPGLSQVHAAVGLLVNRISADAAMKPAMFALSRLVKAVRASARVAAAVRRLGDRRPPGIDGLDGHSGRMSSSTEEAARQIYFTTMTSPAGFFSMSGTRHPAAG